METTTEVCSVALVENGKVVDFREDRNGLNHAKLLTVFISDLLKSNKLNVFDLSALAVSEGPGSYTGLRIGVSAAKGICYAAKIPLIAISPLQAMAKQLVEIKPAIAVSENQTSFVVPMIDARRMEVYTACFDFKGEFIQNIQALVVDETAFSQELEYGKVFFIGNGAAKCKEVIRHQNAFFIDNIVASAINMASLAMQKFEQSQFVDVAYFEPYYLKNFMATTPKNNVLENLAKGGK